MKQRGFTLIEMMISIVIGLMITAAVTAGYLGASRAAKVAELQGRMNEDAQLALNLITQQLRLAGSNPAQPNRSAATLHNPLSDGLNTPSFAVLGCNVNFTSVNGTVALSTIFATDTTGLRCGHSSSTTTLPASVSIHYEADRYNTVPSTSTSTTPTDCLGAALSSTSTAVTSSTGTAAMVNVYEAENRFYIGTTTITTSVIGSTKTAVATSLFCKGNGTSSSAQPVAENVEDLKIVYGTATSANTSTVAGYLSAYDVEQYNTGTLNRRQQWGLVRTVRVCVVVRSAEPVSDQTSMGAYYGCPGANGAATLITPTDQYLRRTYSTTVELRNRAL